MRTLQSSPLRSILEASAPRGELIPGLLPADGIAILTAAPKVGKTMFASQAALAIQEGTSFLGFPPGPAGSVLYCDHESSADDLRQRFKLLEGDAQDPYALTFCRDSFQLAKDDDVDGLIELVQTAGHSLIIIDTLATYMLGIDENDAGSVSRPMHGLRRLQHETGAAILVVAHGSKSESHAKIAAKTRGSNAITATPSTLMVLTATVKKGTLSIESRFGPAASIPLIRRADGFWERDEKGVALKEAA
jgi:RecA-family ATPase